METSAHQNLHSPRLVRQLTILFVITLFVLAAFQSAALVSISYDLPQSPLSEPIINMAETWNNWMHVLGIADWTDWISDHRDEIRDRTVEA